jgi:hypothetical protein
MSPPPVRKFLPDAHAVRALKSTERRLNESHEQRTVRVITVIVRASAVHKQLFARLALEPMGGSSSLLI